MQQTDLEERLERYEGFDGAKVLGFGFSSGDSAAATSAWIELKAYSTNAPEAGGEWVRVRVVAIGEAVFSWKDYPRNQNVWPNWPAKLLSVDGLTILDLDPLHPTDRIGDAAVSAFFLGGKTLTFGELG